MFCSPAANPLNLPEDISTGDIILFDTLSCGGCLTRVASSFPYDHLAMVLETDNGWITVECTNSGVTSFMLRSRLADPIIRSASVRRLREPLTVSQIHNLNRFLAQTRAFPYSVQCAGWIRGCCTSVDDQHAIAPAPQYLVTKAPETSPAVDTPASPKPKTTSFDDIEEPKTPGSGPGPNFTQITTSSQKNADTNGEAGNAVHECDTPLPFRSGYVCTSFVGACLVAMQLLPQDFDIDALLPSHFSTQTCKCCALCSCCNCRKPESQIIDQLFRDEHSVVVSSCSCC